MIRRIIDSIAWWWVRRSAQRKYYVRLERLRRTLERMD